MRVVFLLYHGYGHFNACLGLAKEMQEEHFVIFAGYDFFKGYVESHSIAYYKLHTVPFGLGFEPWVCKMDKKRNIYFNSLYYRITDRLYSLRERELTTMVKELKPDLLLIDSLQATDFVCLYASLKMLHIKVAFIQTMLPTRLSSKIPPLNSLSLPNDKSLQRSIRKTRNREFRKKLFEKIIYMGRDNESMVIRRMQKNKIPTIYHPKGKALLCPTFSNIPEFILAPKEFDFTTPEGKSDQVYIGFRMREDREEISMPALDEIIIQREQNSERKRKALIYCSFGSVNSKDNLNVKPFLLKLINIVKDNNYELIIALSESNFLAEMVEHAIHPYIHIFSTVPQLKILSYADLFISHGGLNSIKESIHAEVPLLIYPVNPKVDQNGNSSRVIHHGIGIRGSLTHDQEKDIFKKIQELLNNPLYAENMRIIKKIDQQYNSSQLKKALEGLTFLV